MLKHCRNTPTRDLQSTTPANQNSRVADLAWSNSHQTSSLPPTFALGGETMPSQITAGDQLLLIVRASVMVYHDTQRKWVSCGNPPAGISKVHMFVNHAAGHYKIYAVKVHDQEVVMNCVVQAGIKYNEATPLFHQWRDGRQVYGLNFASKEDARSFSENIRAAIEVTSRKQDSDAAVSSSGSSSSQASYRAQNTTQENIEERLRSVSKPATETSHQNYTASNQNTQPLHPANQDGQGYPLTPNGQPYNSANPQQFYSQPQHNQKTAQYQPYNSNYSQQTPQNNYSQNYSQQPATSYSQPPSQQQYIHSSSTLPTNQQASYTSDNYEEIDYKPATERMNSRTGNLPSTGSPPPPPSTAPPPAPSLQPFNNNPLANSSAVPPPSGPPPPPSGSPASPPPAGTQPPPPPPPPPMSGSLASTSSFAAAIQSAKLRKTEGAGLKKPDGPVPVFSSGSDLMQEMQKKLAKRRAQANGDDNDSVSLPSGPSSQSGSPRSSIPRRPSQTAAPSLATVADNLSSNGATSNGACGRPEEWEALKQELLIAMRAEINKVKQEILAVIRNG